MCFFSMLGAEFADTTDASASYSPSHRYFLGECLWFFGIPLSLIGVTTRFLGNS